MDISLETPGSYLFVRRTDRQCVTLMDRELRASFLLAPDRVVENWPVQNASQLGEQHIDAVLALEPELVILGTGERQQFPPAAFMARFLSKGIGVEVMDNAAAARTYDLLAGEGRKVVAGFMLPALDA